MTRKRTNKGRSKPGARASKPGKKPEVESALKPSQATRDMVAIAAGGGTPEADIACALGIELSTLRRVYRAEVSTGAFRKRVELVQTMYAQAKAGNTGAAKAYLAMQPATTAPPAKKSGKNKAAATTPSTPAADEPAAEAPVAAPKPVKLGKKDQANATARTAQTGSAWASVLPNHNRPQ
jgi:hypothetical protein